MKIIAGDRKGHNLTTPKGSDTRPTLSRVKEALFSIISGDVPGSVFYDLFAGAGAIGLEALSRGARKAVLIENAREAGRCLHQNVDRLRYKDDAVIIQGDAVRWPIPAHLDKPDIVFADPPYKVEILDKFIVRLQTAPLPADVLVILQTPSTYHPKTPHFKHLRTATYGTTALHFYLTMDAGQEADDQPVTGSR